MHAAGMPQEPARVQQCGIKAVHHATETITGCCSQQLSRLYAHHVETSAKQHKDTTVLTPHSWTGTVANRQK